MSLAEQHNVRIRGAGETTYLLAHGIGGSQEQWNGVAELLEPLGRVVTFDIAGFGKYDPAHFNHASHASLFGFADDLARLVAELNLAGAVYVGHSLSGMAGLLAAAAQPELFDRMIVIGASACYIDDPVTGYVGGFTSEAVERMLADMAADYEFWASGFATIVMQNENRPHLAHEFGRTLAACPPEIAITVFRAAFTGDFRAYMPRVQNATLVLNASSDPAVPLAAARWLVDALPHGSFGELEATGHFPHVVDPAPVAQHVLDFTHA